ncbi:hypothetical protein SKAU_G00124350 [Synaphobranchus kaupii]|uniref:Iron hydrogenase small subunit domain-containing protein n=1 Tax=Synaphobranchus kaupii TaxID=118154 RepID=A0A9Q1J1R5_SYNKA|nr:hypothetical protein SKAU_G00124350 [Synaphobranchus kaupii]
MFRFGEADEAGLVRHEGRGSEGFLEHVFKNAAKELFGLEVNEIVYKTLRNRDFQEVSLERDGETLLQFAAVYGFRNIQTLVHRMRKGRVPYQLVEVLSCPGGCLSGRGQAEGEGGRVDKVLSQQMEEAYSSLPVRLPEVNPELQRLYQDWLQGQDPHRPCRPSIRSTHSPSSSLLKRYLLISSGEDTDRPSASGALCAASRLGAHSKRRCDVPRAAAGGFLLSGRACFHRKAHQRSAPSPNIWSPATRNASNQRAMLCHPSRQPVTEKYLKIIPLL